MQRTKLITACRFCCCCVGQQNRKKKRFFCCFCLQWWLHKQEQRLPIPFNSFSCIKRLQPNIFNHVLNDVIWFNVSRLHSLCLCLTSHPPLPFKWHIHAKWAALCCCEVLISLRFNTIWCFEMCNLVWRHFKATAKAYHIATLPHLSLVLAKCWIYASS